jgi:serine protease
MPLLLLAFFLVIAPTSGQTILPAAAGVRVDPILAGHLRIRFSPSIHRDDYVAMLERRGLRVKHAMLPYDLSLTARRDKVSDRMQSVETLIALEEPLLRTFVVEFDPAVSPEKLVSMLQPGCSEFDVCEPLVVSRLTGVPDDPQIEKQKMLSTIRLFDAWDVEGGSDTVIIGISDSGVLVTHEDLKDAIAVNTGEIPDNGIDDDNNGFIDDHRGYNFTTSMDSTAPGDVSNPVEGHGTGVAGICGATVNNAIGIAGVAGACKLFPLKTMPLNVPGIVYGYESIMYCALNGIDIVNCSWGSSSKSCIDQTVIDYAVARGVAVVAAAGNHGTSAPFYPGSYNGVLNVGVTDPDDVVIHMTGYGPTVDVMAPGQTTWTTSNDGTYGSFCCTSGAAPIAAGLVGLVRSKHPELGPLQACAVVREAVAESPWTAIGGTVDKRLLPKGRVDALRAVTVDPDSLPSVEFTEPTYAASSLDSRWGVGDTVEVSLGLTNVLGSWTATHIDSVTVVAGAPTALVYGGPASIPFDHTFEMNDSVQLEPLRFAVTASSDVTEHASAYIRGRTSSGEAHEVRIVIPITPTPPFRTMQNNIFSLSVGDRARIGIIDHLKGLGDGVTFRSWCGQMYEGGLMISTGATVVDAVRGDGVRHDHFRPRKTFTRPSPLHGIVRDDDAPDSVRIGIEIEQVVALDTTEATFTVTTTVRNVSDTTVREVAVGWFYDWDLGSRPVENTTSLLHAGRNYASQIVRSTIPGEPVSLSGSVSRYDDAEPISVGLDNTTTYRSFSDKRKIELLFSGTGEQFAGSTDISVVNGMRFTKPIPPGHERSFTHFIMMDTSETAVRERASRLIYAALNDREQPTMHLWPNPTTSSLQVEIGSPSKGRSLSVFDVEGREVITVPASTLQEPMGIVVLDVSMLASGAYYVRYASDITVITRSFIVLR